MLRWITAGESHGPALVAVLEGLPAGVPVTTDRHRHPARPPPARVRPGRADEVRTGRGDRPRRCSARAHHGWSGRGADRQHRMAEVGTDHGGRSGGSRTARRARPQRAADQAAAGPRRPRRNAEVRVRGRPTGAGAGIGPGDRRPGRARHGGAAVPACRARRRGRLTRGVHRRRRTPSTARCRPRSDRDAIDESPVRALHPDSTAAMVIEIEAAKADGDTLGGRGRGAGLRAAAGARLLRPWRPPARRPAGRRADGHPGDQGCGGRRRVRHGTPPRLRGP